MSTVRSREQILAVVASAGGDTAILELAAADPMRSRTERDFLRQAAHAKPDEPEPEPVTAPEPEPVERPSDHALAHLLRRADTSPFKRVQARATRIRKELEELRAALAAADEKDAQVAERQARREAAMAEVHTAERALAAARAKAREAGQPAYTLTISAEVVEAKRRGMWRAHHARGMHDRVPKPDCPICQEQEATGA